MVNFAITKFNTTPGSVEAVSLAMETYIETIDNAKTIRLYTITPHGSGSWTGVIHHDT